LHIGGPNTLKTRTSNNLGEEAFWDSLTINELQLARTPHYETYLLNFKAYKCRALQS